MGGSEKKKSRTPSNRWSSSYYFPLDVVYKKKLVQQNVTHGSRRDQTCPVSRREENSRKKTQIIRFYYAHYYASFITPTAVPVTSWAHFTGKN